MPQHFRALNNPVDLNVRLVIPLSYERHNPCVLNLSVCPPVPLRGFSKTNVGNRAIPIPCESDVIPKPCASISGFGTCWADAVTRHNVPGRDVRIVLSVITRSVVIRCLCDVFQEESASATGGSASSSGSASD